MVERVFQGPVTAGRWNQVQKVLDAGVDIFVWTGAPHNRRTGWLLAVHRDTVLISLRSDQFGACDGEAELDKDEVDELSFHLTTRQESDTLKT